MFTDQRDDAEASGEKVKRRSRNEVCAAYTDLTEIFDLYHRGVSFNSLCLWPCGQKFNFFFHCRKLVEQTMMEHENTKEARRKLQEYKQKLGKVFFVEFLHRSTMFSYDILLEFLIILHGQTAVLVPTFIDCLHQFCMITSSCCLLTFYSHFFIVQFGVVLLL